ncbi:MAG: methyltransferase family protein [bacterium]
MKFKIREWLFRWRGVIPIPFLIAAIIGAQFRWSLFLGGFYLSLIGEVWRLWAISYAGGSTRTRNVGAPELVTTGPYSIVPNPLYLANLLHYLGFSLASGSLFPYLPIITGIFFAFQYHLIIQLEEKTLLKLFGDKYQSYLSQVPRIFPNLHRYKHTPPTLSLRKALREERSTLIAFTLSWSLLILRFIKGI